MAKATLFIPDISGFTKFVKSTEINHSKHIIEELINLIIKEGSDNFKVAEIEGDAVFFYTQNTISYQQLIDTTRQIFLAFHQHLLKYENQRICNCGACQGAVDLNLKFVVNQGDVEMVTFNKQQSKPYGDAVIEVHRLLKNDIEGKEYILFATKYLDKTPLSFDGSGSIEDPDLGTISFRFKIIDDWRNDLKNFEVLHPDLVPDIQVEATGEINLKLDLLLQLLSDFQVRYLWDPEASLSFDANEINQTGTEHQCLIGSTNYEYETIKPHDDQYELSYGEMLRNARPFKHFEYHFFLNALDSERSVLVIRIKAIFRWKIQRFWNLHLRKKLIAESEETIESLKKSVPEFLKLQSTSI